MLKKYIYFLLLMLASVYVMPSCSEDDVVPPVDEEVEEEKPSVDTEEDIHVPNPAGDDFYKYVNGEWLESLTDLSTPQGYNYDMATLMAEKTSECLGTFEPLQLIQQSLIQMLTGGQDANLQRVEEIIEELLAEVETEADAYQAIGKMIGMGLGEEYAKLYMYPGEGLLHFTIVPPAPDQEVEEQAIARSLTHKKVKKLKSIQANQDQPTM